MYNKTNTQKTNKTKICDFPIIAMVEAKDLLAMYDIRYIKPPANLFYCNFFLFSCSTIAQLNENDKSILKLQSLPKETEKAELGLYTTG